MEPDDMRRMFEQAIDDLLLSKRADNKALLSLAEYKKRIFDVKQSKLKFEKTGLKRTMRDYRLVRKYDVLTINGIERLIRPVDNNVQNILYYVNNEELFDILHTTHLSLGHGGRNRMISDLKANYSNITKESIMIYLRLCETCQKKSNCLKKLLVPKPNLHSVVNSRAQIDIIDMESKTYNEFRFIMFYQDQLTKFTLLKPLKSKCSEEIAVNLLDIYTTFGAPAILDSDNGIEFVSSVLAALYTIWDGIKIVPGKPMKEDQTQGTVEMPIREVEEMVTAWMEENNSEEWPMGLKLVQFKKNQANHAGLGTSPYEAMFGRPARVGILSVGIPQSEIPCTNKEEDIEAMMTSSGTMRSYSENEMESEDETIPIVKKERDS